MSILAGYANSSLSRLSRAVTRLEAKGWVRRAVDPEDGRFTLAILTERGADKVEEATPGHVEVVHRLVLDRLTQPQKRQLREITHRILRAIDEGQQWALPVGIVARAAGSFVRVRRAGDSAAPRRGLEPWFAVVGHERAGVWLGVLTWIVVDIGEASGVELEMSSSSARTHGGLSCTT